MKRSAPLRSTTRLARRTPMRRVNPKRLRARRAECFGVQAQLCRESRCCVCGAWPVHAHHEPSRGAGGTDKDTVPLCPTCHDERHRWGRAAFEHTYDVDLKAIAAELAEKLEQQT